MAMAIQIYSSVVASAFDHDTQIYMCGSFRTEKDAVMAVVKKVFEKDLISRLRYLKFVQDAIDDGHADINGELEAMQTMTDERFMERVLVEVRLDPTIGGLKEIFYDYCDDYTHEWDFRIELQNIE